MLARGVEYTMPDGAVSTGLASSFDALYQDQWWPMLRLATGLVDQASAAEDVVQDAFAALYRRWDKIREPAAAVGYLRISVVNGCRSALRRRGVARRHLRSVGEPPAEAADASSLLGAEHAMVRTALAALPDRQREVLTLRYLADLSDSEIAEATGLSPGGVRSASSRGLAALRSTLGGQL
ncbi:MAG TPA: SigE family RNA polymerase sigma factor [Jatrophihabitans sp.]|nr:SigE family RNA polymerase sigma factor [Jatrophihabitans sp.]